jgi:hypothetical protein
MHCCAPACRTVLSLRCTATRYNDGTPCRATGMPVIRPIELLPNRWPGDARLPQLPALHMGDRPGSARQAAMVGKPPA